MLLLGSFNILLQRYSGQTDLRVGVPMPSRNPAEVEGLIGLFVKHPGAALGIRRPHVGGDPAGRGSRTPVAGAQAHQDLPFESAWSRRSRSSAA